MEKGNLVEFRLDDGYVLAIADRPEGKKYWIVIDDTGKSHTIRPKDVTYAITDKPYSAAKVTAFKEELEDFLDPENLEVAWELLVDEGGSTTAKKLAEVLFSDDGTVPSYAAHALLSRDKLFFKQKGDRYEPRPRNQVAEMRHQQEKAQQRAQEQEGFLGAIAQVKANEISAEDAFADPAYRQRIELIERFVVQGDDMNNRGAALDLLKGINCPANERGAFDFLVQLGVWSVHENLYARRAKLPSRFSAKVLDVVHPLAKNPPPDPDAENRLDLTHLKLYTIDDESTREIDDGLSIEILEDGRERIWVHIADPTRWLTPGDTLDLEARRRVTTVYLPTGSVPMFPFELAAGPMSLVQGEHCYALSFAIVLSDDGAVESYEIHPSTVKPTYRLTYDDVDEMLQLGITAESELQSLAKWSKVREQWRRAQGAIVIDMPESSIKVKGDDVSVELLEDSTSRYLVAEMMILVGEVAARYGQSNEIPLPFRAQPQPELPPDEELMLLPPGPVRACALRRCMPRSETTISPARHASLALDFYTQATSPIRRYNDLITHFQIKAHLRGDELPFSSQEMQELLQMTGSTAYEAVLVERQTNRYWALEYLRRHSDEIWTALVLRWIREDELFGSILIEDLGLELVMRFKRDVELGDRLNLRVAYADPRQDNIQFQEVAPETVAATTP
ncbi:MAG: ribonuclease R family protein [Cyanobacteria bacterium P01_C01_bin.89]